MEISGVENSGVENSGVENSGGKNPVWGIYRGGKSVRGIFRGGIFSVGKIPGGKKVGGEYSWWGIFRGGINRGGTFREEFSGGEIAGHRFICCVSAASEEGETEYMRSEQDKHTCPFPISNH